MPSTAVIICSDTDECAINPNNSLFLMAFFFWCIIRSGGFRQLPPFWQHKPISVIGVYYLMPVVIATWRRPYNHVINM